jgi:hypothetical protein
MYDPDDGRDPPAREIIETPAYMFNEWPFGVGRGLGITAPLDDDATLLALSRQHLDQVQVDFTRREINYWHALQKLYRDAGWDNGADPGAFDGVRFERESADWIRRYKDIESESDSLLQWKLPSTPEQHDFVERWEAFWSESAGDLYV